MHPEVNIDTERKAFESWIARRPWFSRAKMRLDKTSDGSYKDYRVNDRWAAFKEGAISSRGTHEIIDERKEAIDYAIRVLRLPNLHVEPFVDGWLARAQSDKAVSVEALEALRGEIRAQAGRREDYQDWDDVEEMLRALIAKETGNG